MNTKNPLYVVKGKDVEEAAGLMDALVKTLGLAPVLEIFKNIWQLICESVAGYPLIQLLNNLIQNIFSTFSQQPESTK